MLDESVDVRLAAFLRSLGHDVKTVGTDLAASLDDPTVLASALREQRVLITNDCDFGELVFREGASHSGVILLRMRTRKLTDLEERLRSVVDRHRDSLDEFLVVTEHMVRIRLREE